jgi:hypothetical protein
MSTSGYEVASGKAQFGRPLVAAPVVTPLPALPDAESAQNDRFKIAKR